MAKLSQYSMDLFKCYIWIIPIVVTIIMVVAPLLTAVRSNLSYIIVLNSLDCFPFMPYFMEDSCSYVSDEHSTRRTMWGIDLTRNEADEAIIQLSGNKEIIDGNQANIQISLPSSRDLSVLALGNDFYMNEKKDEAYTSWRGIKGTSKYFLNLSKLTNDSRVAIELLHMSLKVQPNSEGFFLLGQRYEEIGQGSNALINYERAIQYAEKERDTGILPKIYIWRGHLSLRLKKPLEALESYNKALQIMGNISPNVTINLSKAMIDLGMYESARDKLRSLTQTNSEFAKGWWWLGEVERLREDRDAAIAAYIKYFQLNPYDKRPIQRLIALGYLDD